MPIDPFFELSLEKHGPDDFFSEGSIGTTGDVANHIEGELAFLPSDGSEVYIVALDAADYHRIAQPAPETLQMRMVQWGILRAQLNALETAIADDVLELGKSATFGNVKATHNKGRRAFDYKASAIAADVDAGIVADHTTVIPETTSTDWKMICSIAKVKPEATNTPTPSVKLKLLGG